MRKSSSICKITCMEIQEEENGSNELSGGEKIEFEYCLNGN